MFEFFNTIVGFFELGWSIIVHFFQSLYYLLQMLFTTRSFIGTVFTFFPAIIMTGVTVVFAIALIKVLVGR